MREKILQAIRKFQIETYLVTEKTVEGAELYFIKKELDMRRMKQDAVSAVTIYRDFETDGKKMRGSANINIFPEMTQEEVDEAVKGAYYAASFVKNPFFELPKGKKEDKVQVKSTLCGKSLEEIGDAFVKRFTVWMCRKMHSSIRLSFSWKKQRLRFTIQRALMFPMKKAV